MGSRAEPLAQDACQKHGVSEEVSPPQSPGLDEEPREPFEAVVREEPWSPAQLAGGVVEDGPAGEGDADVQLVPVLHKPAFLKRHPEAKKEHVGPGGVDLRHGGPVLRTARGRVEEAVPDADDL
jgi:hypothetical protein